jgi:hypothetical protein
LLAAAGCREQAPDLQNEMKQVRLLIICSVLLAFACGPSGPRDLESPQRAARGRLRSLLALDDVDIELFRGPELISEDSLEYTFHWVSNILEPRGTIYEVSVPKDWNERPSVRIGGERIRDGYLGGTTDFPLNEAALLNLFRLPPNPQDTISDRAGRLRMVALDHRQLQDVANFVEIRRELEEYASCFNRRYPSTLDELSRAAGPGECGIDELDSLYLHDRYGREYYYENFVEFLLLGTAGKNDEWDFNSAVLDSLFHDNREYILTNDDDILVKLRPFR